MLVPRSTRYFLMATLVFGVVACGETPLPEPSLGQVLYEKNCKVCHAQGLNGAPILGNSKMWEKRAEQGKAVLVQHAEEGFGLMPAKGGNAELSKKDITAVVQYMLANLEG